MPDVQVRITTTGAEQSVQSFNQVAQSSQRFASTTQQTVTQARIATQAFNFVLFDMARIARATGGAAGKEFANSLEGAIVAVSTARGAVAAYRGVLESQELITKSVTRATEIFNTVMTFTLSPLGVLVIVLTAAAVAWAIYLNRLNSIKDAQVGVNGATADAIRLHQSLGHAVQITTTEQERLALALRGVTRYWAEQAERIRVLREQLDEKRANDEAALRLAAELAAEQEQLNRLFHEMGQAELQQVVIPRMREYAQQLQEIVLDARDAPGAFRRMEERLAALATTSAQIGRVWLAAGQALEGLQSEAQRAAGRMGQSTAQTAAQAGYVVFLTTANAKKSIDLMASSFEQATASILRVTTEGSDLFSQLWVTAVNQVIEAMLRAKAVSSFFTSIATGILGFFGLQHGGSFIATRPMLVPVGEMNQAERITVSPLAGAPATSGGGMTLNFNAPQFWDEVTYAKFIKRVGRDLTSGPVSRVG